MFEDKGVANAGGGGLLGSEEHRQCMGSRSSEQYLPENKRKQE